MGPNSVLPGDSSDLQGKEPCYTHLQGTASNSSLPRWLGGTPIPMQLPSPPLFGHVPLG
jgi:hypothetical protein